MDTYRLQKRFHSIVPYVLSLLVCWLFWCTAVSTSVSRISSMQTIEPYAFAVHEQLMLNFAESGSFFQTIHSGYDDKWTWSGHRALTLPGIAYLYGLNPSAQWLAQLMITFVTLGALSCGALVQTIFSSRWGFLWGVLVYCTCPATISLALQDYQDLVFALPFLITSAWLFRLGKWYLAPLAVLFAIAPREECVPMALALSILFLPYRKDKPAFRLWAMNIILAVVLVGGYLVWAERYYPIATSGHDMPLQNAVGSLRSGTIFLEGWLYLQRFYAYIWVPLGLFAFFAPWVALPALALCLLHMSVPEGHGVDRSWGGHCHHMAPAAAFAVASIAIGGFRCIQLFRWGWLRTLLGVSMASWAGWWWYSWSSYYNLILSATPQEPEWEHPAWTLAKKLPDDAVPVVGTLNSIAVSNFPRSYTFDESLYSKERHKGLAVATHMIFDKRKEKVLEWVERMPGYSVLEEEDVFVLATWNPRTLDSGVLYRPKFGRKQAYVGSYTKGSDIPGVPPKETRIEVQVNGSFPIIQLWKNDMIKGKRKRTPSFRKNP